jgi:hypothetical protein
VGRKSQNELTETKQRYAIKKMKIFLIKLEIRVNIETALHKDDYVGAGAADNSHPNNDDLRTGFYNI